MRVSSLNESIESLTILHLMEIYEQKVKRFLCPICSARASLWAKLNLSANIYYDHKPPVKIIVCQSSDL